MNISRDTVLNWLDRERRSQSWLAEKCGVSDQAVSNWLREKNSRPISASAQITIRMLMEEDAAALQAKPPHNLVLEFDDAEYAAIEQAALLKPETVREWAKRVLNEAAEIDAAEFVARLKAQASESILAFPEIPLLHAAAGSPAPSDAETFAPTRSYGAGRFACQLHGESMAPKYPDGSTVILRDRASLKRPLLKNGEIYLFDVGGEKTLKIYQSRPATEKEIEAGISYVSPKDGLTKVRTLRPINPAFQEIVIDGEAEWIGWLDEKDNSPQA